MHDQKKEKQVLLPEEQETAAREHERVGALYKSVLGSTKAQQYNADTLENTEALLLAVPEAYTAYNCRRLAFKAVVATLSCSDVSVTDTEAATSASRRQEEWLVQELKLNSKVLMLNYKNYSAFSHRHWIFDQLVGLATVEMQQVAECATGTAVGTTVPRMYEVLRSLLRKEREQCEQLLQLDERNFHAWNYRRWVLAQELRATGLAAAYCSAASSLASAKDATQPSASATPGLVFFSAEEAGELEYTTRKIKNNFSNYSAWHQRSLAIQSAVARWQRYQQAQAGSADTAGDAREHLQAWRAALLMQLREDVDFLKQAMYCDPNDQSAWFYAPFVFQLLRSQYRCHEEDAVALENAFIHAVIELVAEVDRMGTEGECYLPYYFLLDQLITLPATSLERHITALSEKVPSLLASANGEAAGDGNGTKPWQRCFEYLHARLSRADTFRRCLYDDLFQRALQDCPLRRESPADHPPPPSR
ncbi:hypothetical protein LSCM1_02592 [Leishmania martiniquensis]|uniref:Geranylgeranyl transferase type-2 subunit alpha n=1 Tax=Leishmania martiniquensis TaxID=1580590 RepID=A0A836H2V0_9TRYP|nr:hypothetical protein LSCM1_02592 [Leishmania martiniquensis]